MELDALIRALAPGDVIGRRAVEILDLAYDTRRVGDPSAMLVTLGARLWRSHRRNYRLGT